MIREKILKGLPLDDIFVFDVHGHCALFHDILALNVDGDGMIPTMDALGIDMLCISASTACASDVRVGNQMTLDAIKANPGRIYGYAVPTPWYENENFEDFFKPGTGMLGVKIHAALAQSRINAPGYDPVYEIANKRALPVLIHTWDEKHIGHVTGLAERFKDMKIIIAHSAFRDDVTRSAVVQACKKYENIYVDTAISTTYEGALEWLVDKIGVDRVLFGSDLSFYEARHNFGRIGLSKLSEADKIKIYGENAKKLFAL